MRTVRMTVELHPKQKEWLQHTSRINGLGLTASQLLVSLARLPDPPKPCESTLLTTASEVWVQGKPDQKVSIDCMLDEDHDGPHRGYPRNAGAPIAVDWSDEEETDAA